MGWAAFALVVILCAAVIIVPGALLLGALGFGWMRSVALGAPVGVGALGVVATVGAFVGVPWTWWQPICVIALLGVVYVIVRRRRSPTSSVDSRSRLAFVLGALGVAVFAAFFLLSFGAVVPSPESFPQVGDAAFHLQAVELIDSTRRVNPFGALGALYDPVGQPSVFYPTLWHALVTLYVPLAGLAAASNALMLVTAIVLWPVGLAALSWAVLPRNPFGPLIATVAATLVTIFPGILDTAWAIYPFSLSIALLPGFLALLLPAIWEGSIPARVGAALAFVGIALAQPATALLCIVAVAACALVWVVRSMSGWIRNRRTGSIVVSIAVICAAVALVLAVLPRVGYVRNLARFERESIGYLSAIRFLLNGVSATTFAWWVWIVVAALSIVGAALCLRSPRGQTLVVTAVFFLLIYMAAAGPDGMLRTLTGPFYKDFQRLSVAVIALMLVFASVALSTGFNFAVVNVPRSARGSVGAGLVIALFLGAAAGLATEDFRLPRSLREYIRIAYRMDESSIADDSDAAFFLLESEAAQSLPTGARVIGVPSSGVQFAPVVSELHAFVPTSVPTSVEQLYVAANLDSILTDPEVCRILNEYDVVAFLQPVDPSTTNEIDRRDYPGLIDVDTSAGFELLAESSDFRLWRISACE